MTLFVTGAAGFIGSHLCEAALARGLQVVGIDNFDPGYPRSVKEENLACIRRLGGSFTFLEADVRDPSLAGMLPAPGPGDAVVHLAARSVARESIEQPAAYLDINLNGTLNVLELARNAGIQRFVMAGTCLVYRGVDEGPRTEDDPADEPQTPYAVSKRAAELLCRAYHALHGMNVAVLRFFAVYGPRQRPDMALFKFADLLKAGREVPLFDEGRAVRDFAFVEDVVQGILAAVDRVNGFRIYNLGHSRPCTMAELVSLLAGALGLPVRTKLLPAQPGDPRVLYASIDRARRELGYVPSVELPDGVARFARWYSAREAGFVLADRGPLGS